MKGLQGLRQAAIAASGTVAEAEIMKDLNEALLSETVMIKRRIMIPSEQVECCKANQAVVMFWRKIAYKSSDG